MKMTLMMLVLSACAADPTPEPEAVELLSCRGEHRCSGELVQEETWDVTAEDLDVERDAWVLSCRAAKARTCQAQTCEVTCKAPVQP